MISSRERLRERLTGALLLAAAGLGVLGGLSRFVPEAWFIASVARFVDNLAPWLLAAGLFCALLAVLLGARRSGGVLALLCLLGGGALLQDHLRLTLPQVAAAPEGQDGTRDLRVLFFNVMGTNTAHARAIAQMVIDTDPDIAVLAEAPGMGAELDRLTAHFGFGPRCLQGQGADLGLCDLAIFSHAVPRAHEFRSIGWFRTYRYLRADYGPAPGQGEGQGEGGFTLVGLHLLKPWLSGAAEAEQRRVERQLATIRGPALVVGDFNATQWSRALSELLARTGFRAERRPLGTVPPELGALGLPLDHALVRGGARLVSVVPVGQGLGSNHRGLLVTLRLPE